MARYTERAENMARMLDVAVQTSMLPQSQHDAEAAWRAMLGISELQEAFDARHGELNEANVLAFMVTDPANPSSIVSCLTAARENARAVRGVLTTELWETQNATWLELGERAVMDGDPGAFFEWVKHRCHLARGVAPGHHAGRRGDGLHPPRHLPRARRQHRAHPRREIPCRQR
jgi:uncharacterized alpha-E superfamily protein